MTVTTAQLTALVASWLWPFARVAGMLMAAPPFRSAGVPARMRVGLAVALTALVAPVLPGMPAVDPLSLHGAWITAGEVLIGATIGFAMRLAFMALEVAGQQIATLMGLGFAALVDPQNGIEVPVVSHFYVLLATLVFLGLDVHLVVVGLVIESFQHLPVGGGGIGREGFMALVNQAQWILEASVRIALPAMVALLIVNMGFGVMSRAAPQLNIFAVGFPVSLLLGFVVMALTLPAVIDALAPLFAGSADLAHGLVTGER